MDVAVLRARFGALSSNVAALRAEHRARVLRLVLATTGATLHRREPLYGERGPRRWAGELVDHALPEEQWGRPVYGTVYGLDADDRFVVARSSYGNGGRHHVEQIVWDEPGLAFTAQVNARDELTAVAAVELIDGLAVRGWHVDPWHSIEDRYRHADGRVAEIRSLRVNTHDPRHRELRMWRARYGGDRELVLLAAAHEFVRPGGAFAGEVGWPALDAWADDPQTRWYTAWDARLHRREREIPALETVLDGLEDGLAESAAVASAAAIARGACPRPFVLTFRWGGVDDIVPRWAWLGSDALRVRAIELGPQDTPAVDAVPGTGTQLDLFEHAPPDALRRIRQVTQLIEHGRLPWLPAPGYQEQIDAVQAFKRRLLVALNEHRPAGTTDDYLAWAGGVEEMRDVVGSARADAFLTAMTPPARPSIRFGRVTGPESIERFATRLGLAGDAPRIAASARWSLFLAAASPGRARSRLGGLPPLPATEPWPTWHGRPLSFIAEIHLDEVDDPATLPDEGVLLFFADLLDWTGEPELAGDDGPIRVLCCDAPGERCPAPGHVWSEMAEAEVDLPLVTETPVVLERRLTLPERLADADYWSQALYADLRNRLVKSQRVRGVNAQLLGYPTDGEDPAEGDQLLLLRIGYHRATDFAFQDGGEISFLITADAARLRRWSEVTGVGVSG